MIFRKTVFAALAAMITLTVNVASAQSTLILMDGDALTGTTSASNIVTNDLTTISDVSGFTFAGKTGAFSTASAGVFSSAAASSDNGHYYTEYLIDVAANTSEVVTTTLTNKTGVTNLTERIYSYQPTLGVNGFMGDTAFGSHISNLLQAWSTSTSSQYSTSVAIAPTTLSSGYYVLEVRGDNKGSFAGALSISPVPEPETFALLLAGLALIGVLRLRRKSQASVPFQAQ